MAVSARPRTGAAIPALRLHRECSRRAGRVAIAAVALLASAVAGCAGGRSDSALSARVDALLAPVVAAHEFSGAIVLSRHGRVVYQRGFGMANHAAGVAFAPETPADGGSLAKTFTAAGVWWLAHEGRLDLDAPVTAYVPEFPHADTTVRHLLSHSNGLPPYYEFFDPHFTSGDVRTTRALLAVVARQAPRPSFPPGSRFEYSNLGFDVAALAIERVTGQPYEDFLKTRFFSRLGMTTSFARPARLADWSGARTLGYRWRDSAWQVFDVFDMEAFLGASNVYFSALDLDRWGSANAAGAALPAAVFAAGQGRPRVGGQPSAITGLGWYCDEAGDRCYYTGNVNAFNSFVYWDRARGDSAAFVSNSTTPPWRLVTLQRELVAALAGLPSGPVTDPGFEVIADRRPAVAGTYVADALGTVVLSDGSGGLRLRIGEGLEFDAFQVSRDAVYVPGLDYVLAFSGGPPLSTLHVRSMFVDTVARRVSTRPR